MLSRVANNLFWIGRYVERAENIARLIDAARRMTTIPRELEQNLSNEWASVVIAAGRKQAFEDNIEFVKAPDAIKHLVFDTQNPSCIVECFRIARENARAVRFALTTECWEALNQAWRESQTLETLYGDKSKIADIVDWAKEKAALFRGAVEGTLLRDDGYQFIRLGMSIERTDSTARLIDVKYNVLLPKASDVGTVTDHYQWLSLLQAAAGQRAYKFVMNQPISARGVAEFLMLKGRFPRSVQANVHATHETLFNLVAIYGASSKAQETASALDHNLSVATIDGIFDYGLHEFLTDIVTRNATLSAHIAEDYGFVLKTDALKASVNLSTQTQS